MSDTKIEVGQTLWFVPDSRWQQPRLVHVKKIGRKWITLSDGYRADVGSLKMEEHCWGRLYLSEQAWRDSEAVTKAWRAFRAQVDRYYDAPASVTLHAIEHASALLGIEPGTAP